MASKPKAYDPQEGYAFQLFYRYKQREWDHLDYAETFSDRDYLMQEYSLAYRGTGGEIRSIGLPRKFWNKEKVQADIKARDKARRERRKQKQNAPPPPVPPDKTE